MFGNVTTITHKNNLVLPNIDPGGGRGGGGTSTRKVKSGNLLYLVPFVLLTVKSKRKKWFLS